MGVAVWVGLPLGLGGLGGFVLDVGFDFDDGAAPANTYAVEGTLHEFHLPATGPRTAQDDNRCPGRDLAFAYRPNCNCEAVLRRARYTLTRDIRPDAVARCRKPCTVPAAIRSLPRPTVLLPTAPAANPDAGITIAAMTTANNPNAPGWARA